jgi:antitoxin (DNA-binding transcriptional repressor) of toxin-antitoxin stability system
LNEQTRTSQSLLEEPGRVDEPAAAQGYAEVLSRVAGAGRPVIVRRNGEDLAAVVPLEQLELVREILARQEVERSAARIEGSLAIVAKSDADEWLEQPGGSDEDGLAVGSEG